MSSNLTYYPTPVFKWCCGVYDRRSALMINGVYPIDLYIHINRSILVRCIRRRNAHESGHWRVSDLVSSLWNRLIICSAQLPHGMKMESENLNILHIIQHIGRSVVGCIRYIKGQLLLILEIYTICVFTDNYILLA